MALSWIAADALTGEVIADLPDLSCPSVSAVIGGYRSTSATLPIPSAPENWERATLPGATVLVLARESDDATAPVLLWGGLVMSRTRGAGDTLEVSVATIEAAFDRYYVGDVTYTAKEQVALVADLVASWCDLPIRVSTIPGSTTRDRTYADAEDKTLLSVLTELSAIDGGPEWAVSWEWSSDRRRITPVLNVGDRIGTSPAAGTRPATTFEMPGPVIDATLVEDYTSGKGATDVLAVSTASADERPQSSRKVATSERPRFQFRFTPTTSIGDVATLNAHATEALAYMKDGAVSLSLSGPESAMPALGDDWFIGDDVGYKIGGREYDAETYPTDGLWSAEWTEVWGATGEALVYPDGRDTVPAFPGGLSGTARVIGWELSLAEVPIITPIIVSTGV